MAVDRERLRRAKRQADDVHLADPWERYTVHRARWRPSRKHTRLRLLQDPRADNSRPPWKTKEFHIFCGKLLPCVGGGCELCATARQLVGDGRDREAHDLRTRKRAIIPIVIPPATEVRVWLATPDESAMLLSYSTVSDLTNPTRGHDLFVWKEASRLHISVGAKLSCRAPRQGISTLLADLFTVNHLQVPERNMLDFKIRKRYGDGED